MTMGMTSPRVLVTDMGLVAASGVGIEEAWRCVVEGRSCIGPIRSFDARAFPGALGAELIDVPAAGRGDDERSIHLLLAAVGTLSTGLEEHLRSHPDAALRTAVVLGTSKGVVLGMGEVHRKVRERAGRLSDADLRTIEAYRPGYGTLRLSERLGARGPRSTLGLACASSSMAIAHAAELLKLGLADRAVAGGFDGFSPFIFTGFDAIGALTRTRCRPFDRRRDGTVLGEGAALLVLETAEAALARGVRPIAELEGAGFTADGVHLTAPDREGRGLARTVRQALDAAGLEADDVDYINAHGTGTRFNDAMECVAFDKVFGEREVMPPISSVKSIFGHTLGAAGALDAIISILSLDRQMLPPTVGCGGETEVDGWDFVPGRGRRVDELERVVTTNSGFAGNNTALIFRRCAPSPDPASTNVHDEKNRPHSCEHGVPAHTRSG